MTDEQRTTRTTGRARSQAGNQPTTQLDGATADATAAAEGAPADHFLQRLAEGVGARASVKAVFGEPVERGDLTVVPVARVRWGFGGGSGQGSGEGGSGSGSGGGGGAMAEAVGYLLIGADGATFEPIRRTRFSAPLILAGGLSAYLVIRAVGRLVRR